jgi:pseudaminic acid synthase
VNHNPILYIAEVSANHLGSLERARSIVKAAAEAGATAVKFQTYKPQTMTLDIPEFSVGSDHPLWGGRRLYDLYREAQTPWEWHSELFAYARSLGLIPFSSPFDLTAIEFLESLNTPMYKIASLETGDHRLIRAAAETGKPIIVSTGATEWVEIEDLVKVVHTTGNSNLTLMLCTSSYPSDPRDSHINRIHKLKDEFGCKVGLSDHTLGIGVSIAAIALGVSAIEKHLTLRRSDGGADSAFSMEPEEFAELVNEGNAAAESLGSPNWNIQASEQESRRLRRSLYVVEDVMAGDYVSNKNIRAIRPGGGAPPSLIESLMGRRYKSNYKIGTPVTEDLFLE